MTDVPVDDLAMSLEEFIAWVLEYEARSNNRVGFKTVEGRYVAQVPTPVDAVFAKLRFG